MENLKIGNSAAFLVVVLVAALVGQQLRKLPQRLEGLQPQKEKLLQKEPPPRNDQLPRQDQLQQKEQLPQKERLLQKEPRLQLPLLQQ